MTRWAELTPIGSKRSKRQAVKAVALSVVAAVLVADSASADATDIVDARLPSAAIAASSVWAGEVAYVFGGGLGGTHVAEFNPATSIARSLDVALPTGRFSTSAVWDGSQAYLFGGQHNTTYHDRVLRFTPEAMTVEPTGAALPSGRFAAAAAWTGRVAYILGGANGTERFDEILRYDPTENRVSLMGARLPFGIRDASAVWADDHVLLFGGTGCTTESGGPGICDLIVRYDPDHDSIRVLEASLPSPRFGTSAVWGSGYALIFGGHGTTGSLNEIVRFDPSSHEVTVANATLPTSRTSTSAVWDGRYAYVFGGSDRGTEIVRYDPSREASPGPPVADFRHLPLLPTTSSLVQFFDESFHTGGSIENWRWDFGDGKLSTLRSPVHRYASPGNYTVALVVEDALGRTNATSKEVNVLEVLQTTDSDIPGLHGSAAVASLLLAVLLAPKRGRSGVPSLSDSDRRWPRSAG